jgi:hypothetical protein
MIFKEFSVLLSVLFIFLMEPNMELSIVIYIKITSLHFYNRMYIYYFYNTMFTK